LGQPHRFPQYHREVRAVPDPKPIDRPKIRHRTVADQKAKRQVPANPPGQLATTVDALRGDVEPELQQQTGIVRVLSEHGVPLLYRREVHLFDGVADESAS
jgi:hypothetical protein